MKPDKEPINVGQLMDGLVYVTKSGNFGRFEMIGTDGVRCIYHTDPTEEDKKDMENFLTSFVSKVTNSPVDLSTLDVGKTSKEAFQKEQDAYQKFLKSTREKKNEK